MIESTRYIEIIVGFFFLIFLLCASGFKLFKPGTSLLPILQVKKLRQSDHVALGCTTNMLWFID